ncbi:hypothetical protein [Paenibacillus arenosi]|uniref:MacB-like periplasmic core domain-containing protein n=1 Tax=Paenibacillus arenosi TaxID=2774142 RepID=A0ABR9AWI7_9BACL|nr:hypothetical protein [Paenibacillus arenosi]MBD8498465.1 hypothetical protein [Paenibacillus arenosi]
MRIVRILFRQNKLLNFFTLLTATLLFFFLLVLVINIKQTEIEVGTTENFKNKQMYKLSDHLVDELETEFFSRASNYDKLNEFANALEKSTDFQYFNAIWQPIGVVNFKGDKIFSAYYENGSEVSIYKINGKEYHSVKSIQVDSDALSYNNIQLSQGRLFDDEEYVFIGNQIPVILGAEYNGIYKIGDQIDIEYYQQSFKGTVVGIIQPLQKIITVNRPEILLDRYIMIPAMYFNKSPSQLTNDASEYPIFFRASLLSRANGTILSELDPVQIRKLVGEIALQTGFSHYSIIGANSLKINTLVQMTETNRITLLVLSFSLLALAIGVLLLSLFIKTKRNVSTYKVFLINGATLSYIYKMISLQSLITYIFGSLLPLVIGIVLIGLSASILFMYLLLVAVFSIFMSIMSYVFVKRIFLKLDIVRELKG